MESHSVSVIAPAKVNLWLHVKHKQSDGYHALESGVVFVDLADRLEVTCMPADTPSLRVVAKGDFAEQVPADGGSVQAAYHWAKERLPALEKLQVEVRLTKNIPAGAGLGGGSADAAAMLRALASLCGQEQKWQAWVEPSAILGADVPVCLLVLPALVRGIGEQVEPWPEGEAIPKAMVLIYPSVVVPTAKVFARWKASGKATAHRGNDLTEAACGVAPVIEEVLEVLAQQQEVDYAQMSGSGSACFGVCDDADAAGRVAEKLAKQHPDWYIRPCRMYEIGEK